MRRVVIVVIFLALVCLVSGAGATGCFIIHKTVNSYGYGGPDSDFTIDLKDADGAVYHSFYFDETDTQELHGVPVGDYTVVERNPGSLWTVSGDQNKLVHISEGEDLRDCSVASITNDYNRGCFIIHKTVNSYGYGGPDSDFTIDLKDADGAVYHSFYFDETDTQTLHQVPIGDYTVVERNPGAIWTVSGDQNKLVRISEARFTRLQRSIHHQ